MWKPADYLFSKKQKSALSLSAETVRLDNNVIFGLAPSFYLFLYLARAATYLALDLCDLSTSLAADVNAEAIRIYLLFILFSFISLSGK